VNESSFRNTSKRWIKRYTGEKHQTIIRKPLIHYSLEYARLFESDENICVSTDSDAIAESVNSIGYSVPFIRPSDLATDTAGTFEVLRHAFEFYDGKKNYDAIALLQPTSPFREKNITRKPFNCLMEPLIWW
jgi:N-acylneuraminate cytidylyltransferase